MDSGRGHRGARVRPQWTDGPAGREPARPSLLLTGVREPAAAPNIARFQFLDPASYQFYPDGDSFADVCVAILRTEAGRNPHDKELHDLIGELSTRSDEFRTRWGAHNVRHHSTGSKTFHHPVVGDLTIAYEGLEMAAEPGLTLTIYTAEPGSPSEEGLRLPASWAASQEKESATRQLSG